MQDDRAGRRDSPSPRSRSGSLRLIEPPGVWFAIFLLGAGDSGSLQVLHDETGDAADHALDPDRVAHPAGRRRRGLPRRDPPVPFGLALDPGPARRGPHHRALSGARGAHPLVARRPRRRRTHDRAGHHAPGRVHRFVGSPPPSPAGSPSRAPAASPVSRFHAATSRARRGDAAVAFLLGYRAAALRVSTLRDALWSAATYGIAIAIAAAALRFVRSHD